MRRALLVVLFLASVIFALANYPGLARQGTYDSIILDFRDDISEAEVSRQLDGITADFNLDPRLNSIFSTEERVYILSGTAEQLRSLRSSPLRQYTESIEPNYIYQTFEVPNDPDYGKQWNLRSINVEAAWEDTKGRGITVAIIDTGISPVPDLENTQMIPGYDFVNDTVEALDDNGHGTHVAGTIAQSTNNQFGVAGVAYEASLMPLKVLSSAGGGTVADIAEAIRFAADHGADVINMSLGGGGDTAILKAAIDYAYQKNVVIVAAAGNANTNAAAFPARYAHVIAVSALDATGVKAPYSNFGAGVDIAAPGGVIQGESEEGGILQNTIDPATNASIFKAFQGTSMAAPHVAGVAALVKAAGVEEPDAIAEILKKSARVVQEDKLNHYGAGHLDASAAVKLALKGQITVKDFFRWLQNNGYLNLKFWFDGGAVALLPKLGMVLGSYLLAWFLRNYLPWFSWMLASGLVAGSSGVFFLQGLYVFDLPQWPLRLLGSSIPELAGTVQGSSILNPLFASGLIPFVLIALLLGHAQWKWFAIGSTLGVASCLAINAMVAPSVLWLGQGAIAQMFLISNALLCFGLAYLAAKAEAQHI